MTNGRGTWMGKALAIGALLAAMGSMSGAHAADAVIAAGGQKLTPAAVIHEGDSALFANLDASLHSATSVATDADGAPLFDSGLLGVSEIGPVKGIESVPAGVYEYYCSQHPTMTGILVVAAVPDQTP